MTELRLLTFNALFRGDVTARLRMLGDLLEESTYDIVCLQEVMYRHDLRLLTRSYPHVRASGSVLLKGGLAFLSRRPLSGYPLEVFKFRKPVRPEWLMRKGFQVCVVGTPAGPVTIVNTHLSANRAAVAQAELAELTKTLAGIAGPLVVTGDFNLPRTSEVLADFVAANGLTDAMAGDARPTYRPTAQWPNPPAFDHVLTCGVTARSTLVLQDAITLPDGRSSYLSDHYGVATTLRLEAPLGKGASSQLSDL